MMTNKLLHLIFFNLLVYSITSQSPAELNGNWVADVDSSENLLYTRDTVSFQLLERAIPDGCVNNLPLFFADSTGYINPEMWCGYETSSKHSPFKSNGMITYLNDSNLVWKVETWNRDLSITFYGDLYFNYVVLDKKLTLIRNRKFD